MTTIAATQYSAYQSYATTTASSTQQSNNTTAQATATNNSATNVTLSGAAETHLNEKDFSAVIADVRAALDKLLEDAGLTSPYKDGKLAIDLSSFDRREIFAIATTGEEKFTDEERQAASDELVRRFDVAMAGPAAVGRVTGDLIALYEAAEEYLDNASAEEKATTIWAGQKAAVVAALEQFSADPDSLPVVNAYDPVADYLARADSGDTAQLPDFSDVANDVRTALDKQYDDAEADGQKLVFNARRQTGQMVDYSEFDSRSISAVALNEGDQFSSEEVRSAQSEMDSRSRKTLLACFTNASSGSDPTAFAKNIISAFASLSDEERTAAGWSEDLYQSAILNYQSSSQISDWFSGSGSSGSGMGLLNYL